MAANVAYGDMEPYAMRVKYPNLVNLVCLDVYELTLAWLSLLTSIYMGFIAAVNVCKVGNEASAMKVLYTG